MFMMRVDYALEDQFTQLEGPVITLKKTNLWLFNPSLLHLKYNVETMVCEICKYY